MPAIQFLGVMASLLLAAGGTYGAERILDRYGRPPVASEVGPESIVATAEESEAVEEAETR